MLGIIGGRRLYSHVWSSMVFGKVKRPGDSMTAAELQKEAMAEVSSK